MRRSLLALVVVVVVVVAAVVAAVAAAVASAAAKKPRDDRSAILYAHGAAIVLSAPQGWVLDSDSGASQGLDAVFYPRGSSLAHGKVMAYAKLVPKSPQLDTVDKVMEEGLAQMRAHAAEMRVEPVTTFSWANQSALLRSVAHDPQGGWETLAFIDAPKVVVMVVLVGRDHAEFDAAAPAYQTLLRSYRFLGKVSVK